MADTKENKTNSTQKPSEPKKPWGMPGDIAEKYENKSLVAEKYGNKKEKTWDDVKKENGNDPAKISEWLNNNPGYKAGNRTKKGMEEFGYSLGKDGKWSASASKDDGTNTSFDSSSFSKSYTPKFDIGTSGSNSNDEFDFGLDKAITGLEKVGEEFGGASNLLNNVTNKDGSVNEQKAIDAMSKYEQKLVEAGAGSFDEDGKFVFKDTTKKGWEDWATMLSVGLSAVGLAMGVPIIPINFRKITSKDEKDAKIREFQKQYTDIMAGNAAKVEDVKSSSEAGKIAKENEKDIGEFSKYQGQFADYKAKSDVDTGSEKELIETRTDAEIRKDVAQFNRDMKRLQSDRDFQLKYTALQQQYAKEMEQLKDALSTNSAIDVMRYQQSGFLKDLKDMGMSFSDIASYTAAKNGVSPADKNWNRVKMTSDMVNDLGNTAANVIDQFTLF